MDKLQTITDLQNKINELEDINSAVEHHQCLTAELLSNDSEEKNACNYGNSQQEPFDRIVRLVSIRDRSYLELKNRLLSEGFELQDVKEALNRAVNCNLVNDNRFASQRIRGLISKGRGIKGIERDLEKFGIEINTLEGWPEDYFSEDSESELKRALALLNAKPSRAKNQLQGNYSKLIRLGYSADVSMRATKIYNSNNL